MVGMMLVGDNETQSTWSLFLSFIRTHVLNNCTGRTVIADQKRGCAASLLSCLPCVRMFHFTRHLRVNVLKQVDRKTRMAFHLALFMTTYSGLEYEKSKNTVRGTANAGQVADAEQYPCKNPGMH